MMKRDYPQEPSLVWRPYLPIGTFDLYTGLLQIPNTPFSLALGITYLIFTALGDKTDRLRLALDLSISLVGCFLCIYSWPEYTNLCAS